MHWYFVLVKALDYSSNLERDYDDIIHCLPSEINSELEKQFGRQFHILNIVKLD